MKNNIQKRIAETRTEYVSDGLDELTLSANPLDLFEKWITEAEQRNPVTCNTVFLATVGSGSRPSGRIVLLRGYDERGFVFYTNYDSRKGNEINSNNNASMTFFWNEMFRQVRIEGKVFILPDEESDQYFSGRPRESQIAALASGQSSILQSRKMLEEKVRETEKLYEGREIARPSYWGGYFLSPLSIEFWQGRVHRLHDRILYSRKDPGDAWITSRLYP